MKTPTDRPHATTRSKPAPRAYTDAQTHTETHGHTLSHTDGSGRAARRVLAPLFAWSALVLCVSGCGPLGLEKEASDGKSSQTEVREGSEQGALVIEGRTITVGEVHDWMQEQFIDEFLKQPEDQIYEMHEKAVRELVQRHVIEEAAAEQGVAPEALFEQVTGEVAEPTLEDVTEWYAQNQARLRGARLEEIGSQIKDLLANERRSQAWAEFVGPRVEALDWELMLEPPRKQLEATRLARGPADAPVTIMSFSDYQCPYCIRSEPVLAEVLSRYPDEVRLIHRHFPLDSIHPFARPASEAAMCAEEQGRFWDFHDAIFAKRGRIEEGTLGEIGEELGLDGEALAECIAERRYADFVEADFLAGQRAGVTGTPAFFVNGIPLKGARDADDLSRVVDSELERIRSN